MTEERRLPNWLGDREEFHMKVKREKKLTEYQLRFYEKELKRQKKMYEGLVEGIPKREKSYKPRFKTREELDQAYIVSDMTVKEYMTERRNLWNCYSDRGYIDRIAWLTEQRDRYKDKLDRINGWTLETKRKSNNNRQKKFHIRRKWAYQKRRYRKKIKMKRLEERWKRYGLIK